MHICSYAHCNHAWCSPHAATALGPHAVCAVHAVRAVQVVPEMFSLEWYCWALARLHINVFR